jgi:creatinine amidohydrolase
MSLQARLAKSYKRHFRTGGFMQLWKMTWPAVNRLERTIPVVIPIAALEQHGHHLPVSTDSLLLGEVCRRAEEQLGDRALFGPLMWMGNSHHHLDFPGTVSASPRVYIDLLRDLAESFLKHGFCRILFLNGHGGNIVPSQQAVFELRQKYRDRHDLLFLTATYWLLGSQPASLHPGFTQTRMGHACQWETSMVLRLHPEWVGDYKAAQPVPMQEWCEPAVRGWVTQERTVPGHIGDPREASAEKGELLFRAFTQDVVQLVERVRLWQPEPMPSVG